MYSTVHNLIPSLECLLRCVTASPRASDNVLVPTTVEQVNERLNYDMNWREVYRLWRKTGNVASIMMTVQRGQSGSTLLANLVLPKYGEWILQINRRAELTRYGCESAVEKRSIRVCGQFLSLAFDSWDARGRITIFEMMASVINKTPKTAACAVYEVLNGHFDYTDPETRSLFVHHLLPLVAMDMGIFCPSLEKGRVAETWEALALAVWVNHLTGICADDEEDVNIQYFASKRERRVGIFTSRLITNVNVGVSAFTTIRICAETQKSIFGPNAKADHIKEEHSL